MAQSKIIQYISTLPPKKQERFRQFVYSPYFNQHHKTRELLDILLRQLKRKKPKTSKEQLFELLFPGNPYDEQKLFNVLSYLKKMYQKFLACEFLEEEEERMELLTLEATFKGLGSSSILKSRAKQLEKKLDLPKQRDIKYYYANFRINYLLGFHELEYYGKGKHAVLQKMHDSFDHYYIAEKLKMCCLLHANTLATNVDYDFTFLKELLNFVRENWSKFADNVVIRLYYNILMSQMETSDNYYDELMRILKRESDCLNKEDQKNLYDAARNYCVKRINEGKYKFNEDLFQLYQEGVKNGMLIINGNISEWEYKNLTTIGCALQKFDWIEQFLEDHKKYLPADKRENAYSYNRANLFFHKKQYEKVQETLIHVQFTDVKYHLNSTILLLRTYYKTGDTEALLSSIETFRIFIMRNKEMPTSQKRGLTNFLRFKKKLALIKHNAEYNSKADYVQKITKLQKAIEETEQVHARNWLLKECAS